MVIPKIMQLEDIMLSVNWLFQNLSRAVLSYNPIPMYTLKQHRVSLEKSLEVRKKNE